MEEKKICTKCGKLKELSMYHKNKNRRDGIQCQCKECTSRDGLKDRKNNPEKYKEKWKKDKILYKEYYKGYHKKRYKEDLEYRESSKLATIRCRERKVQKEKEEYEKNKEFIDWVDEGIKKRNKIRKEKRKELQLERNRIKWKENYYKDYEHHMKIHKIYDDRHVEELHNCYVRKKIIRSEHIESKLITDGMIQIKRVIIQAKRALREHEKALKK